MNVIESQSHANYTFRKIKEVKAEMEQVKKFANDERILIDKWETKSIKPLEETLQHYETLLLAYYNQERALNPKFKLNVPNGKISTRKAKKYTYEDETAITEWLWERQPQMIKTVRSFNKTEFKKVFKDGIDQDTGEVVPGVTVIEEESHTIKIVEVNDNE